MILNMERLPRVVPVGIQTESGVEEIGFDLSPWLTRWPEMSFAVWPTRPGESASYIAANTELVGNVLYWYPNAADTEKEGAGTVEVVGIGGGKCKSSGVIDTVVKKTTLDVTQETPEPMKLWAEKVVQAAKEVRDAVDAGGGGLYLVNVQNNAADRTYEEIKAALNAGKTCLLRDFMSRAYLYSGVSSGTMSFRCVDYGVPIGGGDYTSLTERHVNIMPDGRVENVAVSPVKTPNPHKLTLEQNGVEVVYDGSKAVKIKIEGGIPDPVNPHQQLVSDADGKAVWLSREFYSEDAKKFPWHMVPEDDAPSAIIYKSDGTDSGVRWVKVSDYTPDVEKAVALGTVQTNEYNTLKVSEETIFDSTANGYLIAREVTSATSGSVLRTVYAVVCFKAGYVAHGYPAPQSVNYHAATIPEPGLYLPVTSNEQTYYGILFDEYVKTLDDKYIPDSIARKEDLENIQPSGSVTDEHINSLIDNKLAAFGGVYLLNKQALAPVPDGGIFAITTPWANPIAGGAVYKVNYNDTDYECECIELPADMDTPAGMFVMGNLSALGFEGGNVDAPFAIVMYANGMAGMYGGVIPIDGATSVTLSIRNTVAGYYFFDGNVAKIVTIDQLKADLGLT